MRALFTIVPHAKLVKMVKFYDYSAIVLQGTSNAGKTFLMKEIILQRKEMFFTFPTKIIYIYNHFQELYKDMLLSNTVITFLKYIPTETQLRELCEGHEHTLLVCDDKLIELNENPIIAEAFVRLAHHLKMTVFVLLQISNLSNAKYGAEIIRNTHYHIMFKSGQMGHILRALGTRINDYKNLSNAYKLATENEIYSYLSVNIHPRSQLIEKYSTKILSSDTYTQLFIFDSSRI